MSGEWAKITERYEAKKKKNAQANISKPVATDTVKPTGEWAKITERYEAKKNVTIPATATESRSPVGSGISSRDDWYRVYRGRVGNQQAKYNKLKTLLETMDDYDIKDFETVKKDLQNQLTEIESSPAYRNSAFAKKYAGKTSAQLETLAKQATDLYEKSWLETASKATMTDEDYKYRIARNTDEKRRLEAMFAEVPNSGSFLQSVYASTPVAAGTKHGITKAELAKKYGYSSWNEATDRYDAIERELYFDTNARKYHAIPGAEDFEEKSQYDESKGVGVEAGEHAQYNRLNQMDMEGSKVGPALLRDKYDYMSEEQRAIYNYIYNTEGKESAEEYLDYMSYQYNTERQTGIQRDAVDFTDSGIGKAVASGVSVPLRLASGIALVDVAGQKIRNAITGENRPVDFNTGIWSSRSVATGLRTGMAQNFNELSGTIQLDEEQYPVLSKALNGKGAGDLYSLGMSMADSAAVAALSPIIGPGGVALLASSAGADGIQTALENGATENQAIAMGAINGMAEALFEYVSLDNLLKGDPKTVLKAALKQGGIEASEEGATSIANIIGDYLVMAENSEWQKDIAMYMNGGDDVKTATWKAFWGKVAEVAMDSIGGALSGSVMGGGTTAVQNAQAQVQFDDQMSDILENAAQYGVDSNATKKAQSKVDAGKKVSGATIRQVMEETQAAQQNIYTQEAMSVLAQVEIDGDQELLATAIGKYIAGQTLTRAERTEIEQNELAPVVVAIVRRNIEQRQNKLPAELATEQEPTPVTATETAQEEQIPASVEVEGEAKKIAPAAEIGQESASADAAEEPIPMSVAEDEAEELQKNAKTYGEEAEAYLASFESGQNVAEYDTAWKAGYELGMSQVPQAQAMESSDLAYLTPGQRVDAYEAGLKAAGVLAGQKETRLNSMTRNATGTRKRGIVRAYNGINTATLAQKFNDSQRKAYKILSTIADVTGIEIVLYESTPEADGAYREDQGKYIRSQPGRIFVDLNAGLSHVSEVGDMANYTMLATFTHEFVHFCENWNPIRYNELRKAVFDAMAENNINVEERIDQLMAESKGELSREDASREAVAEALVEILPDANFVGQLANEHKTLFRKLLERLKEFLQEIKDYFSGMRKSNDPTVAALKEEVDGMTRYMEHIVKLFDNVAVEAVNWMQASDRKSDVEKNGIQKHVRKARSEVDEESTIVNDNPEAHTPEEQAVIEAYKDAVDPELLAFIDEVRNEENKYKARLKTKKISDVTQRAVDDVKRILGVDVSGYSHVIDGSTIAHIEHRHGTNGQGDSSMRDENDMARIGYVLANYDHATIGLEKDGTQRFSEKWRNSDNTKAPTVVFSKKINGTYYVVEAVPNTKRHNMTVITAYINKKGVSSPELNMSKKTDPQPTSETLRAQETPINSIAKVREEVNTQFQRRPGATFVTREAMQEYRHKRHESELKKRYKMRIRKTIMDLDKLLNRGTKQANVKEEMRELVSGTLRAADMLFMDEYTAADMIRSGIGVELTDREAAHLEKAKDILAQMDAIAGSSQESMQKRDTLKKQLDAQTAQMREVFQRERKRIYGAKVADVLNQLSNLYSGLSDSEAGFIQAAYDENVADYLRNLHKLVGDVTVRDMSAEQMENLSKAFTMILTKVRTANKAFAENIRETIETLAMDTIAQEEAQKTRKKGRVPALDSAEALWFNNEKPVYAFERIGSNTLSKLYGNVADGENTFAEDINEAKEFKESIAKKYRMTEWDFKGTKTFRSSSGLEFELNLGHLMSLYAYAKRPAAHDHITKGGIVFPPSTKIRKKVGPFQMIVRLRDATAYNISDELLQEILSDTNLTQEQKEFVDEMQDYLSSVMGEKGNEVSLAMYGIRQFGEKNYFPIRSSATYMAKAEETELKKQAGQATLASAGFTKATVPKASNPIVLDEFMSVWANHVNDMSLYHAFVLPLADFQRVYNYNTPNREGEQSKSVKAAISNAHGDAATSYIRQLISDVNGGVMADPRETMVKKLISGFKKASVLASWSVLVQQPSAMYRAEAMIDRKYFGAIPVVGDVVALSRGIGRALLAHKQHVKLWEQAKKYAPGVVTIKEIGGFDTATGKGIEDYLANTERQGIKNKAKAFVSDSQYRSAAWENTLGAGPAVADELAWVEIWLACKRETMAKHPGMKWDSEELLQLSGERFTEVIRKTQVYDSVFAKSSYMRSKSSAMAMMTSFMAEPTTTINMAEEMISDLANGRVKKAGKIGAAIVKTMVVNNLLKALIYAMRDEDEDETWLEKYAESVASGLANDINPINYYPYLRDVGSLLSGYEVERADTTLVSDVVDSVQKIYTLHNKDTSGMDETELAEHEKAEAAAWWDLTGTVAACFGIPADNVKRELFGLVNLFQTVERDINGRDTSKESFLNAVWEGVNESLPFFWQKDTGDKREKLYKAVVSGDEAYRKRMESGYKDEDAYHAALRKALRENDQRIKAAAKARYEGDIAKYSDIAKAILAEKHFSQDDILAAIDSEVALLEPEGYKGDPKAKGLYKASDFAAIAQDGEWQLADAIQEDMIATYKLNGKSQRQAETACSNAIKSEIKDGSMAGNISKENAIHALTLAANMDEEEAKAQYDDWMTELQYGVSNSEVKSAYMDGKITKETAIEIRMAYTGDSREKASKTIRDWDAEQATGYVYSDIEKEFLKGRITSGEAIKMYKVYGESDADARQTVTKLEFQKRWPGSDGITAEAVEKYQAFCVKAGVPGTSYYQAWKFSANTTADVGKDGKAISGSKKKKVLNYVNTLPLTSKQKDAIYYAFGWAKSTLSEAPWH